MAENCNECSIAWIRGSDYAEISAYNGSTLKNRTLKLKEENPEDTTYETVEWGIAGWVTHEAGSIDRQYLDEFDLEHFEVVGNIFDNPELLQEE